MRKIVPAGEFEMFLRLRKRSKRRNNREDSGGFDAARWFAVYFYDVLRVFVAKFDGSFCGQLFNAD